MTIDLGSSNLLARITLFIFPDHFFRRRNYLNNIVRSCSVYYGMTQVQTTILPKNPSTINPSRYQKETQCTGCIAQSHSRWLLWVAVRLKCLQPGDGMCFYQRHLTYSLLTFKPSLGLTPDHCHNYFNKTSLTIITACVQ
jgi:hypothetical protein